MDSVEVNT